MSDIDFSGRRNRPPWSGLPDLKQSYTAVLPWPPSALSPNARSRSWQKKARHTKAYRAACAWACKAAGIRKVDPQPITVVVTFHPPNPNRRDRDNLIASFKAGQDGLADSLGVDDSLFDVEHVMAEPCKPLGRVVVVVRIGGAE